MCKKLMVLCLVLVVSVPASAAYIGFDMYGDPAPCDNPLRVDIGLDGSNVKCEWQGWDFGWNWDSPMSKTFVNKYAQYSYENPILELQTFRSACGDNPAEDQYNGGGRDRSGGFAYVGETGEYSSGTKGYGMNYLKLTITQVKPNTLHKVTVWGYEAEGIWSMSTDNPAYPNTKFAAWSTINPKEWLEANGYDGSNPDEPPCGGYGPPSGGGVDSNMPCYLKNRSKRFSLVAPEEDQGELYLGTAEHGAKLCVTSDNDGIIVLYGWIDPTDWTGSAHLPINGVQIVPEPATIALLGLGGLALLRRRKR